MKKVYRNKLPNDVVVDNTSVQIENGELIVTITFDKPLMPKDGDFLVSELGNIFIYSDKDAANVNTYSSYCGTYADNNISTLFSNNWADKKGCRYSTSEEKSAFLERLEKECHKRWNSEKKCLEDIYTPKFGDIVKVVFSTTKFLRNYTICIFPDKPIPSKSFCNNFFDIGINMEGKLWYETSIGGSYKKDSIYPASESEKQELFNQLAEIGKRWNPETKQIEDIRWRADKGKPYYVVNMFGTVQKLVEEGLSKDEVYYNIGNYFKTSKAACRFTKQVQELFKNSKAE